MVKPLWVAGESKKRKQARRLRKKMARSNYRIRYDLAFDGGGSVFDEYYKTRTGALISSFFWRHVRSWGGSAYLYPHPMPVPVRHQKKTRRFPGLRLKGTVT